MTQQAVTLDAAMAETHISWIFFVGDRAFKLKKPVQFGFIDQSTPQRRAAACRREVELNRRLAPDVYLGVADVLGPEGAPCDQVVVMRRMPGRRRLSALVDAPGVEDHIRAIARTLAVFHASARRSSEIDGAATCEAVRTKWHTNFKECAGRLDMGELPTLVDRFLDGRGELFATRIADGKVCDGHGDLLADDIFCLDEGPRILDCIEFDDRLRYGDVLADVAFLAMDLERLGRPWLGQRLLDDYHEFTAENAPGSLLDHYIAYRALIRAKVASIRAEQSGGASAQTSQLLAMAADHLRRARVRLVLVGGPPGSGKSTLAESLADMRGWSLVQSDELRKDLAGVSHYDRVTDYSDDAKDRVYRTLLERASRLLAMGETVVVDASWGRSRWRDWAAAVAERTYSDLAALRCDARMEVLVGRVADRKGAVSDVTPDVAEALALGFEPWPDATRLRTDRPHEDVVADAITRID